MVENCVLHIKLIDFGGKLLVYYYVMHSKGVQIAKHDEIEQHISKKIKNTCKNS